MNQLTSLQYRFGDFCVDAAERRFLRCGVVIPLAPRVFDTLLLLVENPGHLIEKESFMKRLWPETFVGDDALARNISILRKVTGGPSDSQSVIATVPKKRSEEHTSELQSHSDIVCRLLLEKKKK